MIQRIQTVFLLLALVLTGLLFFIPFTNIVSSDIYHLSLKGISSLNQTSNVDLKQPFWLTGIGAITTILIFVVVFLYKNRKIQICLSLVSIVLLLALNGSMYLISQKYQNLFAAEINYKMVFVFPIVSAILVFLAYRSIKKDENLVRSLDRLR